MLYNDAFDRATMNILTSFPFTFKLAVPGLSNPFTSLSTSPTTGTNPPRARPAEVQQSHPEFSERPSRSLARPTRPLPMSVGPNPLLSGSGLGPRPRPSSFSPSPSPSPSAVSLTHGFSHLAPKSHLTPQWNHTQSQFLNTPPQSHSPSPAPLSRKRGWEPSYSSPSESQATLASGSGYLDTPAKYRDLVDKMEVMEVNQRELDEDDLPPTKRRRGIAGSIVSTAWSAALIGTAVGLTVYRLWRDRGKADEDTGYDAGTSRQHQRKRRAMSNDMTPEPSSPPPPYNQEWTSVDYPRAAGMGQMTPSRRVRDKGKARMTPKSPRKTQAAVRTFGRHHRQRSAAAAVPVPNIAVAPAIPPASPRNPEFDFNFEPSSLSNHSTGHLAANDAMGVDEPDVDDQMDWIGGRLAQLIEEGKKALGKEVVVMSDAKEDEVDDGSGAWVSDDENGGGRKRRSGGSVRRRGSSASTTRYTASNINSNTLSTANSWKIGVASTPPRKMHTRGLSHDAAGLSPGFNTPGGMEEDSYACESPEIREMMERARAKLAGRASFAR